MDSRTIPNLAAFSEIKVAVARLVGSLKANCTVITITNWVFEYGLCTTGLVRSYYITSGG